MRLTLFSFVLSTLLSLPARAEEKKLPLSVRAKRICSVLEKGCSSLPCDGAVEAGQLEVLSAFAESALVTTTELRKEFTALNAAGNKQALSIRNLEQNLAALEKMADVKIYFLEVAMDPVIKENQILNTWNAELVKLKNELEKTSQDLLGNREFHEVLRTSLDGTIGRMEAMADRIRKELAALTLLKQRNSQEFGNIAGQTFPGRPDLMSIKDVVGSDVFKNTAWNIGANERGPYTIKFYGKESEVFFSFLLVNGEKVIRISAPAPRDYAFDHEYYGADLKVHTIENGGAGFVDINFQALVRTENRPENEVLMRLFGNRKGTIARDGHAPWMILVNN